MKIELPFPPSELSGHNNGQWRGKSGTVRKYREGAKAAAQKVFGQEGWPDRGTGDIAITVRFIPPDRRGDRMNYPNRIKPAIDGIADALKVNDKRFDPCFIYCAPEKPGRVEVFIHSGARTALCRTGIGESASVQCKNGPDRELPSPPEPEHQRYRGA